MAGVLVVAFAVVAVVAVPSVWTDLRLPRRLTGEGVAVPAAADQPWDQLSDELRAGAVPVADGVPAQAAQPERDAREPIEVPARGAGRSPVSRGVPPRPRGARRGEARRHARQRTGSDPAVAQHESDAGAARR